MSFAAIGLWGIVALLGIIFCFRIPVGFAMALIGFLGFWKVLNFDAALGLLGSEAWTVFSSYGLTVIPLFIFMGQICFYSGVNERLYKAAYAWMGAMRGGLAIATTLACAGFAAICGSNTATAATMSTIALPQMKKYGYHPSLSTGSVAVGATLGVVIPPSVVLIIIGLQTGISIAKLFWAAFLPGALLVLLFVGTVVAYCMKYPDRGPAGPKTTMKEKLASLSGSVEMLLLFALVMGGLLAGFFTPSEAGAAGSAIALMISVVGRHLTWKKLFNAINDTLRISCMILTIIYGAVVFGRFLTITRLPYEIAQFVGGLSVHPLLVMAVICIIYVIGGAVMDALALLIITIPIFFPVAEALGYDPVWFSVFVTIVTTLGAVTPPVGVNTFIVASMADGVTLPQVFKGVAIFIPAFILCLFCMLLMPELALYLPEMIR
ncbi:MAG: TRAP transporter large permease [Desulfovibrio sp.]